MILDPRKPMLGQLARNAEESAAPHLWNGLVLGMPFTEGSGDPYDYAGRRFGTLEGDPQWVPTPWGPGLELDGSGDYVQGDRVPVTGSTDRTIAVLFKTGTDLSSQTFATFTAWGTDASGERYSFRVDTDNGNVLRTEVQGGFLYGSTGIADQAWHMGVSVLRGSNVTDVEHYVDGVPDPEGDSGSQSINTGTSNAISVGSDVVQGTNSNRDFPGIIPFVAVWSRAITATEIQQLHADPFAMFRPRRTLVPVLASGAGDGGVTGKVPYPVIHKMMGAA